MRNTEACFNIKRVSLIQSEAILSNFYIVAFCENKASLQEVCFGITGDAPLYSMFRKYPEAVPVPCPFRSAPFTFTYNRGSGECVNPPSKAESCTDDSRLVLKYQACPDVPSTESNGELLSYLN